MSYVPEGAGGGATRGGLGAGVVVDKKYRLEAPLGQGAMGAVWAATHLGLGEPVAIKFIDAKFAASPDTRQRFETEAKATAKIRSRFVVTVFDMGQLEDGTLYLVMERLHGETLHAYVKRRGVLSLAESVEFACHVGRALSRAHGRGVIHRDIKPANIFLSDTPDDGRIAKVLDFGVAKLLLPLEGLAAGQTSDGALLGTPQYMSPEQARGRGGVDHHTDIYSLGLVFYRMFTGKPPRPSGPVGELIARVLTEPLPKLCDGRADASPALEAWFARACAAEPSERFESVDASVEALVRAAGIVHPLGEGSGRSSGHGRSGSRPSFDRTSASLLLLSRSRSSAPCLPPPPGEPVNMPALPPHGEPVNMPALPTLAGAPSECAVAVSSSASSPNLAGNDEASIATGATSASLPTSRQNEKGPAAKRRRSSAAWVFGALSLATVVFFLGAA
nr:serine/threonine protein kinase [Polyangiaceae bacterium]